MRKTKVTLAAAILTATIASPAPADEIDRLGHLSVWEIVYAGHATRMAVAVAAAQRHGGFSVNQKVSFIACLRGAARDPILKNDRLSRAAVQCGMVAKLQ